jgi:hypothetical protein
MKIALQKIKRVLRSILFVERVEVQNKWWHRLFTVLLFSSGIIVLVVAGIGTFDSHDTRYEYRWGFIYRPVAFSLEKNYQEVDGKELPCDWNLDFSNRVANQPLLTIIECEGVYIPQEDSRRYGALYEDAMENLEKQFGMDKYNFASCRGSSSISSARSSDDEYAQCVRKNIADEKTDPAYPAYQNALEKLAQIKKIKVARDINYGVMLGDIALWLVIPLLSLLAWIAFWSAIVYRAVVYIAYGKKK